MAVNFASVLQASRSLKQGVYLLRVLRNIRDFTTAVAIELDQKSGVKNNLLDAYRKKRIIDETALDGQGPTKCKDLKELVEKERQKVVARYKETELHQGTWTEKSRRAGAVGKKIGMSLLWKKDGRPIRVTLIQVSRNTFVQLLFFQTGDSLEQWFSTFLLEWISKATFQWLKEPCSHICTGDLRITVGLCICITSGETLGQSWQNPSVPQNPS